MLKNIAVALLAATIFTAPALARTGSQALRPVGHATVVTHGKTLAPVKFARHIKKHKRHRNYAHVRHFNGGKARIAGPAFLPVKKGARI